MNHHVTPTELEHLAHAHAADIEIDRANNVAYLRLGARLYVAALAPVVVSS